MSVKRCDIILPTCGQSGAVKNCIRSLVRTTGYPYRLIVIDNGSPEEIKGYLKDISRAGKIDMILIEPGENLGWVRSINRGLELSKDSAYVAFQNDDTVFTDGWLDGIVKIFEKDPKVGAVNPEWEKPANADIDGYAMELKKYAGQAIDTDWCRGHCFLVKREVLNRLGGLEPIYIPGYFDDRDYSLKIINAGYRCVRAKGIFVYHLRNMTASRTMKASEIALLMERNAKVFYKRWGRPLRLIFALRDYSGSNELIRHMCADQNKVIFIIRDKKPVSYEHSNIKILKFPRLFLNISALLYIVSNRSKKEQKKTDFIFTDDRRLYNFLNIFARLIPAKLVFAKDIDSLKEEVFRLVKEKKDKDRDSIIL
ncbi:MAG: glycosyltransferase [Candidatus Omnitrophica bacterium]|nr:glycosyltransferase [Candidatus Omnitrophota bacterium]